MWASTLTTSSARSVSLTLVSFFFESLLEEVQSFVGIEDFSERTSAPVSGDFIMLDALGGRDEGRIEDRWSHFKFEQLLPLLDQSFHGDTSLPAIGEVESLEDRLQPLHVFFGLPKMLPEAVLEFFVVSRLGHFGERLEELLLSGEEVAKSMNEQVAEGLDLHP